MISPFETSLFIWTYFTYKYKNIKDKKKFTKKKENYCIANWTRREQLVSPASHVRENYCIEKRINKSCEAALVPACGRLGKWKW